MTTNDLGFTALVAESWGFFLRPLHGNVLSDLGTWYHLVLLFHACFIFWGKQAEAFAVTHWKEQVNIAISSGRILFLGCQGRNSLVMLEQNCKVRLRSLVQINETMTEEAKHVTPKSDPPNLCGRAAAGASKPQSELAALPMWVAIFPLTFCPHAF